jgi:hypothetical protein
LARTPSWGFSRIKSKNNSYEEKGRDRYWQDEGNKFAIAESFEKRATVYLRPR